MDVTVKEVASLRVASVEAVGAREDMARVLMDLFRWVLAHGLKVASYPMVVCTGGEPAGASGEARFQACIPIDASPGAKGDRDVSIRELPALRAASVRHRGAHRDAGLILKRIGDWARDNGYRPAGPVREIYLVNPLVGADEGMHIEIQVPIEMVRH